MSNTLTPVAKVKQLRPTPGKIIVEALKQSNKSRSGLIVRTIEEDSAHHGRVLEVYEPSISDGVDLEPYVKKGDFIVFSQHAGTKLEIEGYKNVLILRESDILTIVDYEDAPSVLAPTLEAAPEDVVGEHPIAMELRQDREDAEQR